MKKTKNEPEKAEVVNPTKAPKKLTLLNAIEQVVELSEDSNLNDEFFTKAKRYIKYLSKRLSLTPIQAVLFSIFIDNSTDSHIQVGDFTSHLGSKNIKLIGLLGDMDELERRRFIRCRRNNDGQSWRVPFDVVKSLKNDEVYTFAAPVNLTCTELFDKLHDLFELRDENELTYSMFVEEATALIEANNHLQFSRELKKHHTGCCWAPDWMLLLLFCHLFVENDDNNIGAHDFKKLFGTDARYFFQTAKDELYGGTNYWQEVGYIENANSNGFLEKESFKLTDKAKQELLGELNLLPQKKTLKNGTITCDSIVSKLLFYNDGERQQVERLASLLRPDSFKAIQERLTASGMRKGFACLFYGSPGTGKTETVYQLAKQTGRDIVQVNIAEIKSCWVGESEKNIKALFDNYRNAVKQAADGIVPILLFNEADALINQRKVGSTNAVDKMENSMQNIILQEMENLEGILIATTNLTQNLDRAFERRFLYKIEFSKPNIEAKQAIWKSMLPSLNDDEVRTLASHYAFSGGQIENIIRKQVVDTILYGDSNDRMELLISACESEQIGKGDERRKIGFR
jgi:DNA polymerase III delta prime subunit